MKQLMIVIVAAMLALSGCETMQAARDIPPPQSFPEAMAQMQGQIAAMRNLTDFYIKMNKEDCINAPYTDLCTAAREINTITHKYRDSIDSIMNAYMLVDGQVHQCKIEYDGVTLPCESVSDQILAGLLDLRKMLPQGTKK